MSTFKHFWTTTLWFRLHMIRYILNTVTQADLSFKRHAWISKIIAQKSLGKNRAYLIWSFQVDSGTEWIAENLRSEMNTSLSTVRMWASLARIQDTWKWSICSLISEENLFSRPNLCVILQSWQTFKVLFSRKFSIQANWLVQLLILTLLYVTAKGNAN